MHEIPRQKQELRQRFRRLRRQEGNREQQAREIFEQLEQLSVWKAAAALLYYVGARDEVPTLPSLERNLEGGRFVAVPWCAGDHLHLCRLVSLEDLTPGTFGLLEPSPALRQGDSLVPPERIDLALIPGLGFDRQGNRLGYGRGYFDRLMIQFREDCLKIGLAFDCQVVERVPSEPHDQPVDLIVTPTQIIDCRQRPQRRS